MKGQLSAEMLIILAVVLAILLLVASQLLRTAGEASKKVEERSGAIFNKTDVGTGAAGDPCTTSADCKSGLFCDPITDSCQ